MKSADFRFTLIVEISGAFGKRSGVTNMITVAMAWMKKIVVGIKYYVKFV